MEIKGKGEMHTFLLADADGSVHESEVAVIDRLLQLAGMDEYQRPAVIDWGRGCIAMMKQGYGLLSA
jgi:hypothetical protein